jgi:hypothetical protein
MLVAMAGRDMDDKKPMTALTKASGNWKPG